MNKSLLKKKHIIESNILMENRLINEQSIVPLMTVLSSPKTVEVTAKDNSNIIYLSQRNEKGQVIPKSTYSYKIGGKYGLVTFEVSLRKVRRLPNGDLSAEASPTGDFMKGVLKRLVPKKFRTDDNWLYVLVPNAQVTQGINKLRDNKGAKAVMETGQGINITLQLI